MWHWLGAIVFLGSIGIIMLILSIAYFCVRNNWCWCHKEKGRRDSIDSIAGIPLLNNADDKLLSNGEHPTQYTSDVSMPYDKVLVTEQCSEVEYNYILTHPPSHDTILTSSQPSPYMSVTAKRQTDAVLSGLPTSTNLSLTSSATHSIDSPFTSDAEPERSDNFPVAKRQKRVTLADFPDPPDLSGKTTTDSAATSESDKGTGGRKTSRKKAEGFINNVQLKLSLHFAKSDGILLLTINEITGVPIKTHGGYSQVRVSTTLMPDKKKRAKTVWHQVTGDDVVVFGDSFKFVQINRQILISSSFRFRLYGRRTTTRDICVGEVRVPLGEILNQNAGLVTWKTFERRNSNDN